MKYRYHIWAGAAQSSLSRSKSFTRPCGWWLIFHSRPLSPQTQHCKHIATLLLFPWQKIQVNSILYLHQFRLSQRGHTPCHFHEAETSVCVRKLRREFYSDRVFSKNCHICGTNSHVSASSNTTFLTSSSQGSIVIYPLHLHNLHFPPPLPFISHISFIITISTVTLYLEWLSRFVLGEI